MITARTYSRWQSTKRSFAANARQTTSTHAKMNVTGGLPLAGENCSQETTWWNFTEKPSASGRPSSDIDWSTYVIVAVEWITFFVGTVGNFVVLVVLAWRRSTSQVGTQLFVGSLAVADLGLMLSAVWLQAYAALQNGWPFSVISCKLKFTWQFLTLNSSIWTLAALSIDRYALYISASW